MWPCWFGTDCTWGSYWYRHHYVTSSCHVTGFGYLTGDSLFSSFLPFDRRLFFFLFARSCEPWVSRGIWGILEGLRGLIVPGRRGRVIGEGARMGMSVSSSLSLVSVVTCRERWWSMVERIKRNNKGFLTSFWQNFYWPNPNVKKCIIVIAVVENECWINSYEFRIHIEFRYYRQICLIININ